MDTFLNVNKELEIPQLQIQGFIGSSWFFDGNTDQGVQEALNELGDQKEIDVIINSNGGDTFQGIAIGNILKANSAKINIIINGIAASAASIIAMAGDTVKMYPNAQLMIHKAWTYADGNAKELHKTAETLEKVDESVMTSYKARFNGSDKALETLLDNETFMTAEDAINYGLADEIIEEKTKDDNETETQKLVENVLAERENKILAFTKVLEKIGE